MSVLDSYRNKYSVVNFERRNGILQMTLHTDGGSLLFGSDDADEFQLCDAFMDVANDPENRAVILTGTGDSFCSDIHPDLPGRHGDPLTWDAIYRNRRRLLLNLFEIEAPIIAAVNGPARVHAEVACLCDIVLASDTAVFQDKIHFPQGGCPGDGAHLAWPMILGPTRGKYFIYTGQELDAKRAEELGVVNEVLPRERLLPRAWELAEMIVEKPELSVRYTRAALNLPFKKLFQDHHGYGLAIEGLAAVQLRGWRMYMGGDAPAWD